MYGNKISATVGGPNMTSCFTVLEMDYKYRCDMVMTLNSCNHIINLINYFKVMYCKLNAQTYKDDLINLLLLVLVLLVLIGLMTHVMSYYFEPVIKILSNKLRLNEYVAGVTLLSLGNALPEIIANMMPVREHAPIFTITLGNAVSVILISGGLICYMRPFKINSYCIIRDLLFLLLAVQLLEYLITSDTSTSPVEATLLIIVYVAYLIINIVDLILLNLSKKLLHAEIKELREQPHDVIREHLIQKKLDQLEELQSESKVVIHVLSDIARYSSLLEEYWRSSKSKSSYRYSSRASTKANQSPTPHLDVNATRNVLYHPKNPRNLYLYYDSLDALLPFNGHIWVESGWWKRIYLILTSPIVVFCTLCIPQVNYHMDKHGWRKLLNCLQIITSPMLVIVIVHAILVKKYDDWYILMDFKYSFWSMTLTVPLAIFVFFNTRTDRPPCYHIIFISLTVSSSIVLLTLCACEIEVLCMIIGLMNHLSEDFIAGVARAIATAIGDVILNATLAIQGYEKMAFAAVLAGPICTLTIGMGIPCLYNDKVHSWGSFKWIYGFHGTNAQIFFLLTVFTTLTWVITFNFCARRSVALFFFALYFLYFLYGVLVEFRQIHYLGNARIFEPL